MATTKEPKTSGLTVGRAGHDPATYGLKGPASNHNVSKRRRADRSTAKVAESPTVAHELEGSVLSKVRHALEIAGGVHVLRNNAGSRRRKKPLEVGSSDLIAIVAPYGRWLCVETKRPKGGIVSDEQTAWLAKMERYGAVVGVCTTPAEALALVVRARSPYPFGDAAE